MKLLSIISVAALALTCRAELMDDPPESVVIQSDPIVAATLTNVQRQETNNLIDKKGQYILEPQDLERLSLTNLSIFWQGIVPKTHTNDPSGCILSGCDGYICAKSWEYSPTYDDKWRWIGISVFTSQSTAIAAMEFRLRNIAPVTVAGANDGTFPGPWYHSPSGSGNSPFMCVNYRNCIIEVSFLRGRYDENATLLKETALAIISQIKTLK